MNIVKHRKIFFSISGVLILASIISLIIWGLNFGIDFKGGSMIEVSYSQSRPDISSIQDIVTAEHIGDVSVRPTGDHGYIIRTTSMDEKSTSAFESALKVNHPDLQVINSDSVGPILGKELQTKATLSIILVIIAIVLFITFAFRKVSEPVSSFKYGLTAVIALIHDVIIPVGVFSVLGHFYGFEIDALFVTAVLVVLGFSVHDTIVVFDRIREHLKINKEKKVVQPFDVVVGESISQTFTRSITTSLTVLLSLIVLYIYGAEATRTFALALFIGIATGTYSSIFIGSPLLVTLQKWQDKKEKNK